MKSSTLLGAMALSLCLAGIAFAQTPDDKLSYRWDQTQIVAGGFVNGIIAHPGEKDLRYARTDVGGAYRWDQPSERWIPLTDFTGMDSSNWMGVEAIGIDPSDVNRLYLALGTYTQSWASNGLVLVSNDKGRHFKPVPVPFKFGANETGRFAGERFGVDPNLGAVVYLGTRKDGLWKSVDQGSHWAKDSGFPVTGATGTGSDEGAGVIFELFLKDSGVTATGATQSIYVGVSDNNGLYRSQDGGAHWAAVPDQPSAGYVNSGVVGPDGNLYFSYGRSEHNSAGPYAMTGGSIWKYTPPEHNNGQGVWSDISPKFADQHWGYGTIAIDPNNPKILMTATMDKYYPPPQDDIYRTIDGGKTWFSLDANMIRDCRLSPYICPPDDGKAHSAGNWANHLVIDPFDSNHVLYGTGATIMSSHDAGNGDGAIAAGPPGDLPAGGVTHWGVEAVGIEETAVLGLISPSDGPAHLVSALGDIGGFVHLALDRPAAGAIESPRLSNTDGLDFAAKAPLIIARAGHNSDGQFGGFSTDGGLHWQSFEARPCTQKSGDGSEGDGSLAVSADSKIFVWSPGCFGAAAFVTTDNGAHWTAAKGLPSRSSKDDRFELVADRVNPARFTLYDSKSGRLYGSQDGGVSFSLVKSLVAGGQVVAAPAAEGDLWFAANGWDQATQTQGILAHSSNGGEGFHRFSMVDTATAVGFGKAAEGADYPTVFFYGKIHGAEGLYLSTDGGDHWKQINMTRHQYGYIGHLTGDPRIFGRVYLGTNGRGIPYGDLIPSP